jgi:hypothetical protein
MNKVRPKLNINRVILSTTNKANETSHYEQPNNNNRTELGTLVQVSQCKQRLRGGDAEGGVGGVGGRGGWEGWVRRG